MPPKRKHPNPKRKPGHKQGNNKRFKFSRELPKFLDASSTVTASRFAARRLPEMKRLWQSFVLSSSDVNYDNEAYYTSRGCKISKRHLRRRTGSHNRRKRHRFPNGVQREDVDDEGVEGDVTMAVDVQSGNKDSSLNDASDPDSLKNMTRRARRKPRLLKAKHSHWKITQDAKTVQAENDAVTAAWLETHLWHTKRFYMSPPFSIYNHWCIPLGHTNRGSQAALRLAKLKSTIQDATWTIAGRSIVIETKELDDLLDVVERMCGGKRSLSAPFLNDDRVIYGLEVGYGLVYELGCAFPAGLVGPASFLFGRNVKPGSYFVRVFIDGSVINVVGTIVNEIVAEFEEEEEEDEKICCTVIRDATTLIRVRGVGATNVIAQSLKMQDATSVDKRDAVLDWNSISAKTDLHSSLPHGTIVKTQFDSVRKHVHTEDRPPTPETMNMEQINKIQETAAEEERCVLKTPLLQENECIFISQAPNPMVDGVKEQNTAVSGWDIVCSPSLTKTIFGAINLVGGACAIGFVEDSCNRMEAEPPLPLWPRDFPDTAIGKAYWSGNNKEWKVLRYCVEEGLAGGRIKTGLNRLLKKCKTNKNYNVQATNATVSKKIIQHNIDWESLEHGLKASDDERNPVVVVRSSFAAPFIQALNGFGNDYFLSVRKSKLGDDTKQKRRRPRRRVRGGHETITLPPINASLKSQQQQFCASLLSSLSIPALLRCHLVVEGRGTLSPGMIISSSAGDFTNNNGESSQKVEEEDTLGYVTSGGFSQSRGNFHSVGIISSKRFLSILKDGCHNRLLIVKRQNEATLAIKVTVRDQREALKPDISASLTILS